ncbi:MAG: CpaD family pilus assembly lipoprotein [Proteobacteria bacterium]|nr:CpaD family pilus assembly lipoprotein [Pseudomonadota bacterium]MDA0951831.1 CpaD family pilus assembly lipoprotein [Pseudomonadota bacterium]MDA1070338.1 CpaD family pilus assembly lipoprotein [Pseudomonadota bacterium]
MNRTPIPTFRLRLVLALAFGAVLSACNYGTSTATQEETDYRARYPIGVESEVVETVLHGTAGGTLTTDENVLLDAFVKAYIDRGQAPLIVAMGGGGGREAFAATVQQAAIDRGLARSEVLVGLDPALPDDGLVLSFISYTAVVPECGHWYEESSHNFLNANSVNFGCATQHNLGLMLADPSDLYGKTQMEPRDGQRTAIVIDLFRKGQITGAEYNSSGTSIVDVGQ